MEKVAPGQIDVAAEVEVDRLLRLVRLEAEALLLAREVRGERGDGRAARDLAHRPADDEPVPDDRERHVGAERGNRPNGLRELLEGRHRPAAHRREGVGEASGLDEVGRRDVEVLFSEDAGDAGHPRDRQRLLALPEVLVPAGRLDPGAVTGLRGEAAVRPRHPGRRRLDRSRQLLEEALVVARGRPIQEGGHVPRAADDGDPLEALALRGADLAAHRRLAELVQRILVGELGADGDHRFADCLEHVRCGST